MISPAALRGWRKGHTSEQAVAAINAACGTNLSLATYRNWEAGRPMSDLAVLAATLIVRHVTLSGPSGNDEQAHSPRF